MNVKKISWVALFIALSVIGGMIKVPGPVSSIALDSFPALLAAGLLGAGPGALVGAFGHLISALIGGLPMGPLHLLVAAEMAVVVWLFGKMYGSGKRILAVLVFVLLNGLAAPAPFILVMGWPFYAGAAPAITIAAVFNGIVAAVLLPRVLPVFEKRFGRVHA
ncbi:ECF transporter S component [Bacillus sp. B190/17]|uniref:ECF transporter S component n=1 Tax=Bacillus lumedeiriae TaxID=3058829 RepID=A0ABW8IAG2_9BACI